MVAPPCPPASTCIRSSATDRPRDLPLFARLDSSLDASHGWPTKGATADLVLRCDGRTATLVRASKTVETISDPLHAIEWLDNERRQSPDHRWVGYFSYELGGLLEPAAASPTKYSNLDLPLYAFGRVPREVPSLQRPTSTRHALAVPFESTFSRFEYLEAVERVLAYIRAGDVFQVNLSQQLAVRFAGSATDLYERLAPAAYAALIDLGDLAVISHSPELFLRVSPDGRIATRPIKGTRPRDDGMAAELLGSAKDAAELNMIVDLERNDLGRVCDIGSVRVARPREVEAHPTVFHGVAEVEGQLRSDVGLLDLLAATFPSGSVTGAPKIRAMQIIDELEPAPRGPYCGAVGHLDADGSLQFNVAIRTATLTRERLTIPVGGGIVADSDPADEYVETLVKARALLAAAGA